MTVYTFHFCRIDGGSSSFEAFDLASDGATIAKADRLLAEHLSCDHVEVWDGQRAVVARHREQPSLRPVRALATARSTS